MQSYYVPLGRMAEYQHEEPERTGVVAPKHIAEADARDEGDTREEESLEDHNIQGLGAYRDVFDAGGEQ